MFGSVKLVRNKIENKFTYNGQQTAVDIEGLWNFENKFSRNVINFNVDNSWSSHADNEISNF